MGEKEKKALNVPSRSPSEQSSGSTPYHEITSREDISGMAQLQARAQSQPQESLCPPALRERGYSIMGVIGGGAFSKVYRARYKPLGEKEIAVKLIQLDKVPEVWKEKCLKTEMKIIKKLQHPHIIKVWDVIKTRRNVFIFMDLAENDSIMTFMKKSNRPCSEGEARIWFSQVTGAIAYMHNRGIAHRDLKNENILLDRDNNAKLTDFGFACFTFDKEARTPTYSPTVCGTPAYIAPEVMNPPYDAKTADIWSLGVCLYEMLCFCKPFDDGLTPRKLLSYQLKKLWKFPPEIEAKTSDSAKDLVKKLMDPDTDQRPPAAQILKHGWLFGR